MNNIISTTKFTGAKSILEIAPRVAAALCFIAIIATVVCKITNHLFTNTRAASTPENTAPVKKNLKLFVLIKIGIFLDRSVVSSTRVHTTKKKTL